MSHNFIPDCETEQLHLSGQIQAFGALLVLDPEGRPSHASDNIQQYLAVELEALIGQPLPENLQQLVDAHPPAFEKPVYQQIMGCEQLLDVVLSSQHDCISLSFSPADDGHGPVAAPPLLPTTIVDDRELAHCRRELLAWVAKASGHQRCMYYQFVDGGDGHVIDEVCSDDIDGSYLDLRFPASDIPQIARALYLKNPWRLIADSGAAAVAIRGREQRPDLSYSDLRSVSPMHQIYMANMGIASSLSLPIMRNGELDALIACHSTQPRFLANTTLLHINKALQQYNIAIKDYDLRQRLKVVDEFSYKAETLYALLQSEIGLEQCWDSIAAELMQSFDADGVALCRPCDTLASGLIPEFEVLAQVDEQFRNRSDELTLSTQQLSVEFGSLPLSSVAGLAALKLRPKYSSQIFTLYLLREEHIHTVKWGGNPNKPPEQHDGKFGIAPRTSFSKWVEQRIGHSKPWAGSTRLELLQLKTMMEGSTVFSREAMLDES